MRLHPVAMIAIFSTLSACGEDNKSEESSVKPLDAPFLTAADIKVPAKTEMSSQSELLETIQEESFFYRNQPEEADDGDDESDACFDAILDEVKVTANAQGHLHMGLDADMTSCLAKSAENDGDNVDSARMRMYAELQCDGVDLSKYDGKSAREMMDDDSKVDVDCGSGGSLLNIAMDFGFSSNLQGKAMSMTGVSLTYEGAATPGRCAYTQTGDELAAANDCIKVNRNYSSSLVYNGEAQDTSEEDYERYSVADLKAGDNETDVWHRSGVVSFSVNDWQGTVTYSGPATAPAYSAQRAGGTAVTGTLTVTAGLRDDPLRRDTRSRLQPSVRAKLLPWFDRARQLP